MDARRASRRASCVVTASVVIGGALLGAQQAAALYTSDFDGLTGSPAGTVLTGQDGYYIPADTDSVDYEVYTYLGNDLGFSVNPQGGSQFVAGVGPGDGTFYARAQRDVTWGEGVWEISYDVAVISLQEPPTAQNIGSFSIQPSATGVLLHLFTWVDPATADSWNAYYMYYDAGGTQIAVPGEAPGPEWSNLELNHWYRFITVVDFDTNLTVEVTIIDLATGDSATVEPTDWYLQGGMGGPPEFNAFRFFAGGGTGSSNGVAWDNIDIRRQCPADLDGDGVVNVFDLLQLLGAWGGCPGCPEDLNGDGVVKVFDLLDLLAVWGPC
jgi:hypothetical protein